jgi:ATP-dependent Clp protease ATP-binding subunit ClpC
MFERFDDDARRAVVAAQEAARRLGHEQIGTAHLLIGLANERFTSGKLLVALGLSSTAVVEAVSRVVAPGTVSHRTHLPLDRHAKRAIELGAKEPRRSGGDVVGTEHLLLGVLREGKSFGPHILRALGVTEDAATDALRDLPSRLESTDDEGDHDGPR